jgi:hypothetical protein
MQTAQRHAIRALGAELERPNGVENLPISERQRVTVVSSGLTTL